MENVISLMEKHGLQKSSVYKTLTVKIIDEPDEVRPLPELRSELKTILMTPLQFGDSGAENFVQTLPEKERYFWEAMVQSAQDPATIFQKTIGQASNPEWFLQRKNRITASVARKIAKGRRKDVRIRYFVEDVKPNKGMEYGSSMEPTAREQYKILFKNEVEDCGLVVNSSLPWLACTPDGIILKNGQTIVLEIKCPSSCEDSQISVPYVKNGQLQKSHPYYCQIQIQMLLCQSNICHFFIFSTADFMLIEVPFDLEFT